MIFLSYAREDLERANRIYALLDRPSREVFYDKASLLPGMDWRVEIEEKLKSCSLILILCSKYSIRKEGFVQREIRQALDRADEMPEGRVFIIPIRFDHVAIPRKLARYHWLDIESEVDYFDLELVIDTIWGRLHPAERSANDSSKSELNDVPLQERIVILLQGTNPSGEAIFSYMRMPVWKLYQLAKVMRGAVEFRATDFGEVLASGAGEPPEELHLRMSLDHNLVHIRDSTANPEAENERAAHQEFLSGFAEAFRSICGNDVKVPLVKPPRMIFEGTTPLREGIRAGMRAAQEFTGGNAST